MEKKKTYSIKVNSANTKAAINKIQQRLEEDVRNDFENELLPDGSVPRGLISSIARKYGYSNAWVIKLLKRQGIKLERKVSVV